MTKVYLVVEHFNDSDQHYPAPVAVFKTKPTIEDVQEACIDYEYFGPGHMYEHSWIEVEEFNVIDNAPNQL